LNVTVVLPPVGLHVGDPGWWEVRTSVMLPVYAADIVIVPVTIPAVSHDAEIDLISAVPAEANCAGSREIRTRQMARITLHRNIAGPPFTAKADEMNARTCP
jgi:hypothetical protein